MKILDSIFNKISQGVEDRKNDFHTMNFSNFQDTKVSSRCVILRKFDLKNKLLFFNTDIRSPKISSIQKFPETHCLFYSFLDKIQLRISTYSSVHYNDDLTDAEWENTSVSSRKCYMTRNCPSEILDECDDGIPKNLKGKVPGLEESERGKQNFAVVKNEILAIDWLYLSSTGHQRALYEFLGNQVTKKWLAP